MGAAIVADCASRLALYNVYDTDGLCDFGRRIIGPGFAVLHQWLWADGRYGVTEATVYQTAHRIVPDAHTKCIGAPLGGMQVAIPWRSPGLGGWKVVVSVDTPTPTQALAVAANLFADWRCSDANVRADFTLVWIGARQLRLVDEQLRPADAGEIVLGGSQLARGYIKRPRETARAFVPDFDGHGGQRVYRTGDMARRGDDGRVMLLGRMDLQVDTGP